MEFVRDWNGVNSVKAGVLKRTARRGRPKMMGLKASSEQCSPGKGCERISSAIPLNAGVTSSTCF